jgi:peptidyl-prolyl cis-trans isomerase C
MRPADPDTGLTRNWRNDYDIDSNMTLTVNGVVLAPGAIQSEAQHFTNAPEPVVAARRSLAVRELLLQRARELGLTGNGDIEKHNTAKRDAEDALIAQVLDAEVSTPSPTEAECRRHFDTHTEKFKSGELLEVRHILFAVLPGTPVARLRARAETMLVELKADPTLFDTRAREFSNCPSGAHGGNLGQFDRGQMVPEFDKALFGTAATGVLPQLVQTRYGFHIALIERRLAGRQLEFETVRQSIAAYLASRVQAQALMQYVRVLAGQAVIEGVNLDAAVSPLLQ